MMMFTCLPAVLQQLRDRHQACEPVLRLLKVSDPDYRYTTAREGSTHEGDALAPPRAALGQTCEQVLQVCSRSHNSYFRQTERGWFMRTFTNLIEQLRDRRCEQVQWLDLLVAVRGVFFLLIECFDALCRVTGEAGHEVGQEGRACMHAPKNLPKTAQ